MVHFNENATVSDGSIQMTKTHDGLSIQETYFLEIIKKVIYDDKYIKYSFVNKNAIHKRIIDLIQRVLDNTEDVPVLLGGGSLNFFIDCNHDNCVKLAKLLKFYD